MPVVHVSGTRPLPAEKCAAALAAALANGPGGTSAGTGTDPPQVSRAEPTQAFPQPTHGPTNQPSTYRLLMSMPADRP